MPAPSLAQAHERGARTTGHPGTREQLPALDGLRGVAILAVVAFHVAVIVSHNAPWAYRSSPPWYAWPVFAGSLGVDVLFVLSGFLVLRSWRSIRQRFDQDGLRSVVEFARRRGRRILPPFWLSLAILIPWRAPQWLSSAEGWSNIAMFASLNQFVDPSLPESLSAVTWSLTTETHFYVLLPVLAFVGVRYGWGRMLACTLVATVGWRLVAGGTGDQAEWILGRADQFVAGMFASTLVDRHRSGGSSVMLRFLTGRRAGWFLAGGLVLTAVTHGALRLRPKPLVFLALVHAVAGLAVAGLLVRGVCRGRMPILRNRVLGWFGLVSYSLYLWHWPLLAEASARWGATAPVVAGAVGAAVAVSVLSYAIVERPFLRSRSSPRAIEPEKDQRWLGSNTEATIANSPWSISSSSAEPAPLGNST